MFVLGMLCHIYSRDTEKALAEISKIFARKSAKVVESNHALFNAGYAYAQRHIEIHYEIAGHSEPDHRRTECESFRLNR